MKKNIDVDLISDDAALTHSLELRGFEVRSYMSAGEFLKAHEHNPPSDCIVADLKMPDLSGLDLHRSLAKAGCSTPFILVAGEAEVSTAVDAMKEGVFDFLEKPISERVLASRIRQAAAVAEARQAEFKELAALKSRLRALSERERQVMVMVVDGQTSRRIAVDLDLSPRTVEIHRASVMAKMGCNSLAELVRMALRLESAGAIKRAAKRLLYRVVSALMTCKFMEYCEVTMAVAA